MKKIALAILAMALTAGAAGQAMAADLEWGYFHTTYREAEKAAKEQGKPLYLHFTTDWCGWCRRIENDVYKVDEGKQALSGFVSATLDCTRPKDGEPSADTKLHIELMEKYGGSGYPYLVMATADGVLLHTITGYKPLAAFKEEIAKAEESYGKYKEFAAYAAKADKAGLEYNLKALDFYGSTGAWAKAGESAEIVRRLDPKGEKSDAPLAAYAMLKAAEAADAPEDKTGPLADEVLKLDPVNAKGYMEKVQLARANALLRSAGRGASRDKAKIDQAAAAIQQLMDKAEKLSDKAYVTGFLGFVQLQGGKLDEALASMKKAAELEGDGPRAAMYKRYIESIEKAKAEGKTQ